MRRTIEYEWHVEVVAHYPADEDESFNDETEILDTDIAPTYAEAVTWGELLRKRNPSDQPTTIDIALVRRTINADGWEDSREYVYVQDDNWLPHTYRSGAAVPQVYRREVDAHHKRVDWARYETETDATTLRTEYADLARQLEFQQEEARRYIGAIGRARGEEGAYYREVNHATHNTIRKIRARLEAITTRLDQLTASRVEV